MVEYRLFQTCGSQQLILWPKEVTLVYPIWTPYPSEEMLIRILLVEGLAQFSHFIILVYLLILEGTNIVRNVLWWWRTTH